MILLGAGAVIAAPSVGEWYIKRRLLPRVERRFKRQITTRRIEVGYGSVRVRGLRVAKPGQRQPMVRVQRIEARFRHGVLEIVLAKRAGSGPQAIKVTIT